MVCLCYGYRCADDEFYFSDEKYFLKCDIVNFVRVFYKYPDVQNNFKEHKEGSWLSNPETNISFEKGQFHHTDIISGLGGGAAVEDFRLKRVKFR